VYTNTAIQWNESNQTLTFGKQKDTFAGMLGERTFRTIWFGNEHGTGLNIEENPDNIIEYKGNQEVLTRH
jgi:alpha-D-xyloside xylohydrolase